MSDQEIEQVVDEIVDDIKPDDLAEEAEKLGLTADELLNRVVTEVRARLGL